MSEQKHVLSSECYDDNSMSMSSCDGSAAIEFISQAHELIMQLQVVILLATGWPDQRLAGDMINKITLCLTSALTILQGNNSSPCVSDDQVISKSYNTKRKSTEKNDALIHGHKGRKQACTRSELTMNPHNDGFMWRKYGEKNILNAKYPRNYYRCSYSEECGCQARKTVQQEDNHYDPQMYKVTYIMQHTCKPMQNQFVYVMESIKKEKENSVGDENSTYNTIAFNTTAAIPNSSVASSSSINVLTNDYKSQLPTNNKCSFDIMATTSSCAQEQACSSTSNTDGLMEPLMIVSRASNLEQMDATLPMDEDYHLESLLNMFGQLDNSSYICP